ncbi:MAG TPA: nucleotidyltransferase family protein [Bellilinea sp.]|nr:nucleotidyltransferase family protein [Bellilinea sp.]
MTPNEKSPIIAAIVLAAGASRRMGRAKMTLPFHENTVLGTILTTLHQAEIDPLIVVIGGAQQQVEAALSDLPFAVTRAYNPDFEHTEMLDSLKIGMRVLPEDTDAFLIVLGDQPQIQLDVVRSMLNEYQSSAHDLIIPSYQMRRGHPWLVSRPLWPALRSIAVDQTMRDFLRQQQDQILYLAVDTPSILQDMDTPEDYQSALKD